MNRATKSFQFSIWRLCAAVSCFAALFSMLRAQGIFGILVATVCALLLTAVILMANEQNWRKILVIGCSALMGAVVGLSFAPLANRPSLFVLVGVYVVPGVVLGAIIGRSMSK